MFRRPLALTLGAAGLIAGVGCGSEADGAAATPTTESTPAESTTSVAPTSAPADSGDTSTSGPSTTAASAVDTATPSFPSVKMVDLATGESTDLADLSLPNQPILAWFWAPH